MEKSELSEESESDWAEMEFGPCDFGDKRLDKRLELIASTFARSPGASIPKGSVHWKGAKGSYRFFNNEKVTPERILFPHTESTKNRFENRPVILAIQDTTVLNYSSHKATSGLGPGGNREDRGLILHPTLAVSVDGTPLGILNLQVWERDEEWFSELSRDARRKIKLEDKESFKWIKSYREICKIQAEKDNNVSFVTVCDREGDMYDFFLDHYKANEEHQPAADILVRASKNRKLEENSTYLWDFMNSLDHFDEYTIQAPRRVGKPAREVSLELRYSEVTIRRPHHRDKPKENPSLKLYAVYTMEKNPPKGEEPISWMLLTTIPVLNYEDAVEKIEWYMNRWVIEIFFKTLKSGCKTEERQLKTVDSLKSCITVDCIIAWRILFLTLIGRELPNLSADVIFTDYEWKALHCKTFQTSVIPKSVPTLHTVMIQVARLAGFLARKGDGFPGPKLMQEGLKILYEIAQLYKILTYG